MDTSDNAMGMGPFWRVPMEMVRGMAGIEGSKLIVHLAIKQQATFQPHALVRRQGASLIATVSYQERHGPHVLYEADILLSGPLKENAG